MKSAIVVLALALCASAATAETCTVRINATDITVDPEKFLEGETTATTRERLLTWPGQSLTRLRGNVPACTSDVTLNALAQLEGLPDTDGFCLAKGDDDTGLLLVPGGRNFRGRCTASTCERVNGAADDIQDLTTQITGFAYGDKLDEVEALEHASGSVLLSASKFILQRSLEGGASTILGTALATPTAAGATAVTLVAVGGGVWLCSQ